MVYSDSLRTLHLALLQAPSKNDWRAHDSTRTAETSADGKPFKSNCELEWVSKIGEGHSFSVSQINLSLSLIYFPCPCDRCSFESFIFFGFYSMLSKLVIIYVPNFSISLPVKICQFLFLLLLAMNWHFRFFSMNIFRVFFIFHFNLQSSSKKFP